MKNQTPARCAVGATLGVAISVVTALALGLPLSWALNELFGPIPRLPPWAVFMVVLVVASLLVLIVVWYWRDLYRECLAHANVTQGSLQRRSDGIRYPELRERL
jgi:hypothetical protein